MYLLAFFLNYKLVVAHHESAMDRFPIMNSLVPAI